MSFPNDDTGHVLSDMQDAGIDLTIEHNVVFFQLFEKESDADAMLLHIKGENLASDVKKQPDQSPNIWDVDCVVKMVPSYDNIIKQEQLFEQIADKFNGYNDGWGIEA